MKNRSVLIFDTFSRAGGGLAYLSNIAYALSKNDHHWKWVFYCNPAIKGRIDDLQRISDVHYGPEKIKTGGVFGYFFRKNILFNAINEINPDAVISMNQLDFRPHVPSILFLRNLLYFSYDNPNLIKIFPIKNLIQCWILRRESIKSIKRTDYIVTSTAAFKNKIMENTGFNNFRSSVIPFGLNKTTLFKKEHQYFRNTNEILFLQFEFYKELDVALYAIKELINCGYSVHLTVTDNIDLIKSSKAKEISKLINVLGLGSYVSFVGLKSQLELRNLYKSSDVFWFPSYIESFGQGLLEAMANGLPCVVTDTEVFRELGSDCVKYFPMGDYKSLASTTAGLLENRQLCAELGTKSSIRANIFSWENHVKEMEAVLDKLIENKK